MQQQQQPDGMEINNGEAMYSPSSPVHAPMIDQQHAPTVAQHDSLAATQPQGYVLMSPCSPEPDAEENKENQTSQGENESRKSESPAATVNVRTERALRPGTVLTSGTQAAFQVLAYHNQDSCKCHW